MLLSATEGAQHGQLQKSMGTGDKIDSDLHPPGVLYNHY